MPELARKRHRPFRVYDTRTALLADGAAEDGTEGYCLDKDETWKRQASAWFMDSKVAKTSYVAAEIKAFKATPAVVVPAGGASTVVVVDFFAAKIVPGTEVLTQSSGDLQLLYVDENGDTVSQVIAAAGFITAAPGTPTWALENCIPSANIAATGIENQPVVMTHFGAGEYGGNASDDVTMDVYVTYRVLDVS